VGKYSVESRRMAAKTKCLAANNKRRTNTKPTIATSLHPGHPPPPRSADRGRVRQLLLWRGPISFDG
jgi:hypothetical protein